MESKIKNCHFRKMTPKNIVQICSIFLFISILLSGCGSDEADQIAKEEARLDSIMQQTAANHMEFSDEVVQDIIASIPSPLEIASLIKSSGAPYNEEMLNKPENAKKYNSIYVKGLNLGIYGADMGYINLYEKNTSAVNYITAIKGLADDLKVGQFFDFSTLKRLVNNNSNMDSLLYISTSGFENMDKYLKENNRGNISLMILLGGWLEALHISTYVVEKGSIEGNEELIERIGEQKIVLNDILLLLGVYENDPKTKEIKEKFEELKGLYDAVKIVYVYAEPATKEVDGMLVIVDNSTSTVEITEQQLKGITAKVKEIRNEIIL